MVDLVLLEADGRDPRAFRNVVLLRRTATKWLVTATGQLPGVDVGVVGGRHDPRPDGRTATLRRLADDELIAISGGGDGLMCRVLAPGAPFGISPGRPFGACRGVGRADQPDGPPQRFRLTRYAAHLTDSAHARLEVTIVASRAVAAKRRPGYRMVARTVRDTMHAVRRGKRWLLAKPSRAFYLGLGAPVPEDVASPVPTATWPRPDAALPSITETPVATACRVPPPLVSYALCPNVAAIAASARAGGGASVAWSRFLDVPMTRPVAAGAPAGPALVARAASDGELDEEIWFVAAGGMVDVDGGSLLIEGSISGAGVRALPLDSVGAVRGPAQIITPLQDGSGESPELLVAVGAPGATGASVLVPANNGGVMVVRLASDGRPSGPRVPLAGVRDLDGLAAAAALPDGGLLLVGPSEGFNGFGVRRFGADGRPIGAEVVQRAQPDRNLVQAPALAVDPAGRVLVAWKEVDDHRHATVHAWVVDPIAPAAATSVVVGAIRSALLLVDLDGVRDSAPDAIAATALSAGGWGLAGTEYVAGGRSAGWAARLDAAGAVAVAPRRVTDRVGDTDYSGGGLTVAGDTVFWISPPLVAGIGQIRAAQLP
ncbi:MAG: hypothetical protein ABW167_18940 [Baekduia sp.]